MVNLLIILTMCCTKQITFCSSQPSEVYPIILPIFQIKKLRNSAFQ